MKDQVEALFKLLGEESSRSEEAAMELLLHPDWLVGKPPSQLMLALNSTGYDSQSPVFRLARQWESSSMSESLLESFFDEKDPQSREHRAWLIKHIVGPTQLEAVKRIALSEEESAQVTRLLIEALDRLVFARMIGWDETKEIVNALKDAPDPVIREGIVGLLMSLEDNGEKLALLISMLSDSSDFVVAGAANAISQMKGVNLDKGLVDNLLSHPSSLVRESAKKIPTN
ncbi:MAG TPA: HEAT repeat domain-containing protein [Blastocatellia bacterium]|jgi:hypothetical protein